MTRRPLAGGAGVSRFYRNVLLHVGWYYFKLGANSYGCQC